MSEIQITQGYNGSQVSAHVGDTLTIALPEIPATGFRWTPDTVDAKILSFAGDEFQPGSQSGVGGGGIHVFRFAAQATGSTQVRCTLARPWETTSPRDVFNIQVSVS